VGIGSSLVFDERIENLLNLLPKHGDIFLCRAPDHIDIHAEIAVNDDMTHTVYVFPGDGRVTGAKLGRKVIGRFADNFQGVGDGEYLFVVINVMLKRNKPLSRIAASGIGRK
jgi:hypothetical protein